MSGPKASLLKGAFKEVLRTLKEDSAYLAQADQLHSGATGAAALCAPPDAHRAFARLQQLFVDGDPRALWAAGKQRARQRLREAYAAVGRRYDEARGRGAQPLAGEQPGEQQLAAAAAHDAAAAPSAAAAELDERQLQQLYGTDGWARVSRAAGVRVDCVAPPAALAPHAHGLRGSCMRSWGCNAW